MPRLTHENWLTVFALSLCMAALGYWLALGHMGGFFAAQFWTRQLPDQLWEMLTVIGDERLLLALTLPLAMRSPRLMLGVVVAAVLAALACRGVKLAFALPRPIQVLPLDQMTLIGSASHSPALPSGHTAAVFAWAGALRIWHSTRLGGWAMALAGLAGVSRIAVGAHWPLDVLVGAALGLAAARFAVPLARLWAGRASSRTMNVLFLLAALGVLTLPFDAQGYPGSWPLRVLACLWAVWGVGRHFWRAGVFARWMPAVIKT